MCERERTRTRANFWNTFTIVDYERLLINILGIITFVVVVSRDLFTKRIMRFSICLFCNNHFWLAGGIKGVESSPIECSSEMYGKVFRQLFEESKSFMRQLGLESGFLFLLADFSSIIISL